MRNLSDSINEEKQMSKTIGYKRHSMREDRFEQQLQDVELDEVFEEVASGTTTDRAVFQQMLEFIKEGDTVIIHNLARLARVRSVLYTLIGMITERGVTLKFKAEELTLTGDMEDAASQLDEWQAQKFFGNGLGLLRETIKSGHGWRIYK